MMKATLPILLFSFGCGGSLSPPVTPTGEVGLASWNDGASKKALTDFVARVTRTGSPDFVPVPQRIAVFDNDGTLWAEQPVYTQVAFVLDRVKALAPQHPEWSTTQPFKGVLEHDIAAVAETGERGILELFAATHANNTSDEFEAIVTDWIAAARHPISKRPTPRWSTSPCSKC